jgi:phage terminase large subunit-like protein
LTASFVSQLADALEYGWEAVARPNQLPPPGDWSIWLLLAGRGFGKTRVLSEMANLWATTGQAKRIAVIGSTAGDCRDVIVEGESGEALMTMPFCVPIGVRREAG